MSICSSGLHFLCCFSLRWCFACCPSLRPTGEVSSPPRLLLCHPPPLQPTAKRVDMVGPFCSLVNSTSRRCLVGLIAASSWHEMCFWSQVGYSSRWRLQSWIATIKPPTGGPWEARSGTWATPSPARKTTTDHYQLSHNNQYPLLVWEQQRWQLPV